MRVARVILGLAVILIACWLYVLDWWDRRRMDRAVRRALWFLPTVR